MLNESFGDAAIPDWDVADRMRKALRHSGLTVQEMAAFLGVGRNTVSTWINGRIGPSTQTLRLWALRCEVPFEWLAEGVELPERRRVTRQYTRWPGPARRLGVAA